MISHPIYKKKSGCIFRSFLRVYARFLFVLHMLMFVQGVVK